MNAKEILLNPFTLGLLLGLIFAGLAFYNYLRSRGELRRYKRHLSDKLEIEAEAMQKGRAEQDRLKKENENLRVKVAALTDQPDRHVQRDLEIYARAEKRMLVSVPGFAPAWENAKSDARLEIESEEEGRSLPKRVFAKLFAGSVTAQKEELAKALPDAESP